MRSHDVLRIAFVILGVADHGVARAETGSDPDRVHVRDLKTVDDVVAAVRGYAIADGATRVVVSLDESLLEIARWIGALTTAFRDSDVELVLTVRTEPGRVLRGGDLPVPRLADSGSESPWSLVPPMVALDPRRWANRLARRAGPQGLVLLVTSRPPNECWPPPPPHRKRDDCFESGWHEEEVGAAFADARVPLWIVAPEAPFGRERPDHACRFLPYVSRPVFHWGNHLGNGMHGTPLPPSTGESLDPKLDLDELIQLAHERPARPLPRFSSVLPVLLDWDVVGWGRWETDVPSGTGYWSYARACALSGGRYFVFADGSDLWLDRCDRLPSGAVRSIRLDVPAIEQWRQLTSRPIVREARALVRSALERSQRLFGGSGPGEWGLDSTSCLRRIEQDGLPGSLRLLLVNEALFEAGPDQWRKYSATLDDPITAYDHAAEGLASLLTPTAADAIDEIARLPDALRAELELQLFWLRMSAFHLDALRVITAAPEEFLDDLDERARYRLGGCPGAMVRVSDCLDAYDGRRVSLEREVMRAEIPVRSSLPQYEHGNLLTIDPDDPDYRARRELPTVLKNVVPQLKMRAIQIIGTARAIHDRWRQTPWDWLVYYADLESWGWLEVGRCSGEAVKPQPKPKREDEADTTPRRPGAGSTGRVKPVPTGGGG